MRAKVSGAEVITGVDASDLSGVERLATAVGERKQDWLVNNAGLLHWEGDDLRKLDEARARSPGVLLSRLLA